MGVLRTIFAWLEKLFGRASGSTGRSATEAAAMRAHALATIAATTNVSMIPCPWHMDDRPTVTVNVPNGVYRCSVCFRNGSIHTLMTRLNDPHVYEEAVE